MTYDELHDGLKEHGYVIYATQEKSAGVFRLANMGQLTGDDIAGLLPSLRRGRRPVRALELLICPAEKRDGAVSR